MSEKVQGFVLGQAGDYLLALGRLSEAVLPMEDGLETSIDRKDWINAARGASNLSGLQLTLGNLVQAWSQAEQSVDLADRSEDAFMRLINRTTLANGLFQSGCIDEARVLFQEAEQMQQEKQPDYPLLYYSMRGYLYCLLLLEQGDYEEVQERVKKTLKIAIHLGKCFGLHDIALDHLSLGRAHLLQAQTNGEEPEHEFWQKAAHHLNQAVEGLRESGQGHLCPIWPPSPHRPFPPTKPI